MLLDLCWRLARPLLFREDPEDAHRRVMGQLARWPRLSAALLETFAGRPDPALQTPVGPLKMGGPIGLAAGLDKDGEAIRAWPAMGFGFVEVGTVTPRPQAGNPRPRLFRLPEDGALINRMGFNNGGVDALRRHLQELRDADQWPQVPVGANIGKNKDTPNDAAERDYLQGVVTLSPLVDWFTVNVSSPNTPGLRALQEPKRLARLLDSVVAAARPRPVWLKLAPDLEPTPLAEAVDVAVQAECAGIVATNTTISRPDNTGRLGETGGLSGRPLWPLARERIAQTVRAADGRVPVIGVGGIHSVDQVEDLLAVGCAAVQLYSGLIFEGPGLPSRLHRELLQRRLAASASRTGTP
jgi:dihydroorotate dehydrogenase